ncbi:MAG TPA: M20/M25/M40 family metallo-hydrolase [Gemmatimonadales bacterium]|jgi:acetylornithine deacetylase/succinyl-diaminopimelate desuccinylase-like protein|nr:M20/M25/M40 family metallo-hydrolase [Gemmatimonadales bacterium]
MITTSLLLAALAALAPGDTLSPEARRVLADLRYLADDARQGRGLGTRGLEEAGAYIAAQFERLGLRPGAANGTWFQDFTVSPDAPAVAHLGLPATATRNIVAVLPGRSPALSGQVVIIGAHYDHLGLGGPNALDPDSTGAVHNGADDNGSGTVALLEIARRLAAARPARTIVFVAFSGEELGVLGSAYYAKNPTPFPMDSVYAMVNLDMVGRLREGKLLALGAETASELRALLDSLNGGPTASNGARRFDLRASGDGWGPSDHASFYAAKRPVVHFFTDLHEDYHRATDDWDKINVEGIVQVAAFAADLGLALADRAGTLTFVDVPRPQLASGRTSASLGTIPDMSESPGGVRLTGVRTGGPGDLAGIRAGDIIVGIGTHTVANLYDMTNALNAHQPGDTVVVTVRRGTEEIKVTAVLGRRGS